MMPRLFPTLAGSLLLLSLFILSGVPSLHSAPSLPASQTSLLGQDGKQKLAKPAADPEKAQGLLFGDQAVGRSQEEILTLYFQVAQAGDAEAQFHLGSFFLHGDEGVRQNYDEAAKWLQKSADQGTPGAQHSLAYLYTEGWGVPKDQEKALELYGKAADQNYLPALYQLAYYHLVGEEGRAPDLPKTFAYYQRAAELESPMAQYLVSLMYRSGEGVAADPEKADEWLRKSAAKAYPEALNETAKVHHEKKDHAEALKWFQKAADAGSPEGMSNLGLMHLEGLGVEKDLSLAIHWFRKGAEAGNALGEFMIGSAHVTGTGVPQDPEKAKEWLTKAANQGVPYAQIGLYGLYIEQIENLAEAHRWLKLAAEGGAAEAQNQLGIDLMNGRFGTADEAESIRWLSAAANQGLPIAQLNLGLCYLDGMGVAQDELIARAWFRKAAEQGDIDARNMLSLIDRPGYKVGRAIRQFLINGASPDDSTRSASPPAKPPTLEETAQSGNAEAQYKLAREFRIGSGRERNPAQAHYWFREAAKQDHQEAFASLVEMFKNEAGGAENLETTLKWFTDLAEKDIVAAQLQLVLYYMSGSTRPRDLTLSYQWLNRAATVAPEEFSPFAERIIASELEILQTPDPDNPDAFFPVSITPLSAQGQAVLALQYFKGEKRPQNLREAFRLFELAAKKGYSEAQAHLGHCYAGGYGVVEDFEQARHWLQKASEQGEAWAFYLMGRLYSQGLGVRQDHKEAMQWYEEGIKLGSQQGKLELSTIYQNGWGGVEQDIPRAAALCKNAAQYGIIEAQSVLAVRYLEGNGVETDFVQAREWAEKAAAQGFSSAFLTLAVIYDRGLGVEKDLEKANQLLREAAKQGHPEAIRALKNR